MSFDSVIAHMHGVNDPEEQSLERVLNRRQLIYSLDKLKPRTKTKNQIFLLMTFRLCYTL